MSPFVPDYPSKHHRRTEAMTIARRSADVESVHVFQRRTEASPGSFDAIINKWWILFAIAGVVILVVIVGLTRCFIQRWKARPTIANQVKTETKSMSEKAKDNGVRPLILPFNVHTGRTKGHYHDLSPPPFPPEILITPATASPSKDRFSGHIHPALEVYDLKVGYNITDPALKLVPHPLGCRSSLESLADSEFTAEDEADIAFARIGHVKAQTYMHAYQLPLYRERDPSGERAESEESQKPSLLSHQSPPPGYTSYLMSNASTEEVPALVFPLGPQVNAREGRSRHSVPPGLPSKTESSPPIISDLPLRKLRMRDRDETACASLPYASTVSYRNETPFAVNLPGGLDGRHPCQDLHWPQSFSSQAGITSAHSF